MAKILEIDLSKEDYLEIARKAAEEGRVENAIISLKKALRMDGQYLEASMALCDIYNSIHSLDCADHTLFKALANSKDRNAEIDCYNKIAYNHIDVHDYRTADYYIMRCEGDFIFPPEGYCSDDPIIKEEGYTLYNKNGSSENSELISRAYDALRGRRIDDVILLCDRIPDTSEFKQNADYLVLVALMIKEDYQAVIDNAERIIKLRGENVQVLSSLATSYWLTENKDKAYEVIDHILEKQYEKEEDIMQILPLLINTEMHVNVVQYCKKILRFSPYTRDIMMWLAQGLYNIGQHKESVRMFTSLVNIFDDTDAAFHLKYIKEKPEYLAYSTTLPAEEKVRRLKVLQDMVKAPLKNLKDVSEGSEKLEIMEWVMTESNPGYLRAIEVLIRNLPTELRSPIIRKHLIDTDVSFDKMIALIADLIDDEVYSYKFDVVAQCRFKRINLKLPDAFFVMPDIIRTSFMIAMTEIIEADEEASEYVGKLTSALDKVFKKTDGEFDPLYSTKLQLARVRNVETLVGVLIAHTYRDDADAFDVHNEGDFVAKHGLDKKKFDKYYTMIFGEKYEY